MNWMILVIHPMVALNFHYQQQQEKTMNFWVGSQVQQMAQKLQLQP